MKRRSELPAKTSVTKSRQKRNAHLYDQTSSLIISSSSLTDLTSSPKPRRQRRSFEEVIPEEDSFIDDINNFIKEEKQKRQIENTQEFQRIKSDPLSLLNNLNEEYVKIKEEDDKSFEEILEASLLGNDLSREDLKKEEQVELNITPSDASKLLETLPTVVVLEEDKLANSFFTGGVALSKRDFCYKNEKKNTKKINILIYLVIFLILILVALGVFILTKGSLW